MKKSFLLIMVLFSLMIEAQQPQVPQYSYAPGVQWQNHSWIAWGSSGNFIPQNSYQEDWWYDHCNAYQTPPSSGTFLGYATAGYSHLQENYDETVNYNSTYGKGCAIDVYPIQPTASTQNCGEWYIPDLPDNGPTVASYGLIGPKGNTLWTKFTNFNGYYNRIKQLSDGSFIAVGTSNSTRKSMMAPFNGGPLYYNLEKLLTNSSIKLVVK